MPMKSEVLTAGSARTGSSSSPGGAVGAEGGLVTVLRSGDRPLYVGSARNGVTSHDFGSYAASIRFQ